ncbi:hypothetical protein [Rhodococcus jostii]|nr:hypothetical protein [Rhodococcus jostii]
MMTIPGEIVALLSGFPYAGAHEQAFPFLSVDAVGYPHSALLSRAELEPGADSATLLAVVASSRTRMNLQRSSTAALIAVDGFVCHHLKLEMVASVSAGEVLGCVFVPVEHKRDDIGIAMQPLSFHVTPDLAVRENWPRSALMFSRLQALLRKRDELR